MYDKSGFLILTPIIRLPWPLLAVSAACDSPAISALDLKEQKVVGGELARIDVVKIQLVVVRQGDNRVNTDIGHGGLHLGERGQSRGADDHRHVAAGSGREIGHRVDPGAEPGQPADIDKV